ncbi:hypothetical protein EMIHUDRAFT_444395 [Emiliania huxleyi CCMP1516]|uniref:Uncharacterized protein n=2 Tax=Emiliania huxleyi TaxID=2903 RepID=A0A0D3JEB3_EMIH1|nr:hypothetical protein EMIHUDRAFT_444395 [Emiliania huxleyi CCMP1516]EOD21848.1 hypothetical protein EMIHUDRAFT_444395 [Emiliania huxleyi CCMP1516]|eukprot:XP_005774277.1 hypothetical protein EMIHUDRAFT_444395 [Emiliania huxleyi CCMP1516]
MLALAASFGLSLIAGSAPAPVVSSSRVASPVMADKKGPARKSIAKGWSILEGLNNPIDATRGNRNTIDTRKWGGAPETLASVQLGSGWDPLGALKKYDTRLQKPKGKGPINKSEVRTFPSKLMPKGRK